MEAQLITYLNVSSLELEDFRASHISMAPDWPSSLTDRSSSVRQQCSDWRAAASEEQQESVNSQSNTLK